LGEARADRRLAAILAADVADYSHLMGHDEEGTVAAVKSVFSSLLDPEIELHRGRVFKVMGDGVLVEFASAVDAVRCAIGIQRAVGSYNAERPDERKIQFRIGVNVGDIIHDGGDIFGDGVNIAARVQALAEPGTICLSEYAYQQIHGKVTADMSELGEHYLKNIARSVRVYCVYPDGAPADLPAPLQTALPLPDKPSVAVMSFANLSGDPEQEYFADGMAEEIITALSRCHSLFVIARNSSFVYKSKPMDVRQVGRELGVRYVLEGSVRRAGDRLRFTGQLIEAVSGAHIWADRFEGETSDVFALQDRFSESVVAAMEPRLQLAEMERIKRKPADNLNAYDHLLRAQQHIYEWTPEGIEAAMRCLEQALALDPNYALAMGTLANCYASRRFQGWGKDYRAEAIEGLRLARRATELGKDDGEVLWKAGNSIWHLAMDGQKARELVYRSLQLNPNSAIALTIAGWIENTQGHPDKALELLERAQRLSPRDPRMFIMTSAVAYAYYLRDEFHEAVTWAEKSLADNPRMASALWFLAASLGKLGEKEKAAEVIAEVLRMEPQLTLSSLRARTMYAREDVWLKTADGLRLAGMPE
jgi:TolB-like protein/class 3 adenylate cyclase/Tfp pilus assembly protein PilF